MDETGLALDPKSVNLKGSQNHSTISSGTKQQITIVGCVRADGQSLPPMVIWNRKKLPIELSSGEVPGTVYILSEKGWIDRVILRLVPQAFSQLRYCLSSAAFVSQWSFIPLLSGGYTIHSKGFI